MAVAKHYGKCSEMLIVLIRKRGRKMLQILKLKHYGSSKALRIWAPWYFQYGKVLWVLGTAFHLGCRKWGCNKWGLKGCLAALPGNRPKWAFSPFFCLFRLFLDGAKSIWKIQKTEEKGLFPQISSDLLKPPSLKPPFAALQFTIPTQRKMGGVFHGRIIEIIRKAFPEKELGQPQPSGAS